MPEHPDGYLPFSSRPLVVKLDGEGRFLEVNEAYCKLFGRDADQFLGNGYMPLVHEEDRGHTEHQMQTIWSPPHVCDLENRAMTVIGWRWLVWHAEATVDEEGNVLEIHAFGQDITETKGPHPEMGQNVATLAKLLQEMEKRLEPDGAAQEALKQACKLVDEIQTCLKYP